MTCGLQPWLDSLVINQFEWTHQDGNLALFERFCIPTDRPTWQRLIALVTRGISAESHGCGSAEKVKVAR